MISLIERQILLEDLQKIILAAKYISPRQREIFMLYIFDGLSFAEISARCQIHPETVRAHFQKAVRYLKPGKNSHTYNQLRELLYD